jgi:hypothetical protein
MMIAQDCPFETLEIFRQQLHVPFFTVIIFLMSWAIWTSSGKDLIFRSILLTPASSSKEISKDE